MTRVHADDAGRAIVRIIALMKVPSCWLRRTPQRSATSAGNSSEETMPAETASSKSWQL